MTWHWHWPKFHSNGGSFLVGVPCSCSRLFERGWCWSWTRSLPPAQGLQSPSRTPYDSIRYYHCRGIKTLITSVNSGNAGNSSSITQGLAGTCCEMEGAYLGAHLRQHHLCSATINTSIDLFKRAMTRTISSLFAARRAPHLLLMFGKNLTVVEFIVLLLPM